MKDRQVLAAVAILLAVPAGGCTLGNSVLVCNHYPFPVSVNRAQRSSAADTSAAGGRAALIPPHEERPAENVAYGPVRLQVCRADGRMLRVITLTRQNIAAAKETGADLLVTGGPGAASVTVRHVSAGQTTSSWRAFRLAALAVALLLFAWWWRMVRVSRALPGRVPRAEG